MRIKPIVRITIALSIPALTGCSDRDPVTATPVYHVGTPTNRSTTYSWIPNNQPYYVQPGVNGGEAVPRMKEFVATPRFEPYAPLASEVYGTLKSKGVAVAYIIVAAKGDSVKIEGNVPTMNDKASAVSIARTVPGVRSVIDEIRVR